MLTTDWRFLVLERPSLHALAIFAAVVEHGTMTAAAEVVGISQPAISTQVKALEGYYGTPLMQRSGRRVEPTETGLLVADYAHRIIRLVDELGRTVVDRRDLLTGRLALGASSTVGEQLLPEVLGRYRRAYPGIELALSISNSGETIQAVKERAFDLGIVGRPTDDEDLTVQAVFDDRLEIFVAPDSPYACRADLSVADLRDETFVLREVGSATRELALRCLARQGCKPENVIELGSNEAVKRAVSAGLGIGVLSVHTTRVDHQAGLVATLDCAGWECRRSFYLIHRRDRALSSAERALLQLLQI